jgi:hypothetical protein
LEDFVTIKIMQSATFKKKKEKEIKAIIYKINHSTLPRLLTH